ncbi:OLC1v1023860C1 [Oldenlandia corymbosa var. corymbosa]|uniref:OLC1v1023860C1 n=1 Tax=Oldenlandia corymbosa var. corymbosa TaxID=529605 RepID=A0AAV1C2L1_OLDCO|nr:OLC1v1023860C1 [Oldenlandia corymbosa var. corymbosa]
MVYDPYLNPHKLRVIELPSDTGEKQRDPIYVESSHCGVSQGSLMYFEITRALNRVRTLRIWELQEEKDNKWCLQHEIRTSRIVLPPSELVFSQLEEFNQATFVLYHSTRLIEMLFICIVVWKNWGWCRTTCEPRGFKLSIDTMMVWLLELLQRENKVHHLT